MDYRYLKARGALNESGLGLESPAMRPSGPVLWHGRQIPADVLALLPRSFMQENLAVPVAVEGETITVAVVDPDDIALADRLSFLLAKEVSLIPASRDEIAAI